MENNNKPKKLNRRERRALLKEQRKLINEINYDASVEDIGKTKRDIVDDKIQRAQDLTTNMVQTTRFTGFTEFIASEQNDERLFEIYRMMDNDSVISGALNLYADNATQVNPKTGHVLSIESKDKTFQAEVNEFLWDVVRLDTEARNIARNLAKYGKVLLDTRASNNGQDWSFMEVVNPEMIIPLTYGQDSIKYYAIKGDVQEDETDGVQLYKKAMGMGTDITSTYSIEQKDRYVPLFLDRKNLGTMEVITDTATFNGSEVSETLYMRGGKSILQGVIGTWQTLTTLEDSLFVSRLIKSSVYNLVTIDVGDADGKQTTQMVNSVKNAFRASETIDKQAERYSNRQSPIPINDNIYVPKKGEKGLVTVDHIGGDVGQIDLTDIDYQRNKLFAGLGIPKAYLGWEETTPGSMGDGPLVMLDERFTRGVQRIQEALKAGTRGIVDFYWANSGLSRDAENRPDYEIVAGKLSSGEENSNRETMVANLNLADQIIATAQTFPELINEEKLFKYVFETVVGIDVSQIDKSTEVKDIEVKMKDIRTGIIESDGRYRKLLRENIELKKQLTTESFRPTPHKVLKGLDINVKELVENNTVSDLIKDYDIFIELKGIEIPIADVIDRPNIRKLLGEATYKELKTKTAQKDPKRIEKSKKITGKYVGLDENNYVTFKVTAEDPAKNKAEGKPTSYETKVSLKDVIDFVKNRQNETDLGLVRHAMQGNVAVACTCPASMYWGQQYNGTQQGYSIVKNNIAPERNLPTQVICKHVAATLTWLPFWSNTIVTDLRAKGVFNNYAPEKIDKAQQEILLDELTALEELPQETEVEVKDVEQSKVDVEPQVEQEVEEEVIVKEPSEKQRALASKFSGNAKPIKKNTLKTTEEDNTDE